MTNEELKFRAKVRKSTFIYFTIRDLVDVENHLFSTRELLIPWLLKGNKPDRFTGLTDRKGDEIYEGDIIKGQDNEGKINSEYPPTFISFKNGAFVNDYWGRGLLGELEVIGNVYEHPNLIREE